MTSTSARSRAREGPNRRILTFQLARKQYEADKLPDAEATLRAFYDGNRADAEAFAELARVLGAQNKMDELATLYGQAFEDVRKSGVAGDDQKARVVALRDGMIATLTSLGNMPTRSTSTSKSSTPCPKTRTDWPRPSVMPSGITWSTGS